MIKEPESKFVDYVKDGGPLVYHYVVEHDGKEYKAHSLAYASYLAEKFNSMIWLVMRKVFIKPYIGKCGYCKKHKELHFIDGNRGSFPQKDDEFGCEECGSVYRIIDILMETGAYKDKE